MRTSKPLVEVSTQPYDEGRRELLSANSANGSNSSCGRCSAYPERRKEKSSEA